MVKEWTTFQQNTHRNEKDTTTHTDPFASPLPSNSVDEDP
jgi:hypothetical protein